MTDTQIMIERQVANYQAHLEEESADWIQSKIEKSMDGENKQKNLYQFFREQADRNISEKIAAYRKTLERGIQS